MGIIDKSYRFREKYLSQFEEFEDIMVKIKDRPDPRYLDELKKNLNSFFKGSECREVIYTRNTDKMFFGMAVIPYLKAQEVNTIIQTDRPVMITGYYLELDSKLFSPFIGLDRKELTAILLHEVGHMVNDASPVDRLRKNLDTYLAMTKGSIKLTDNVHYQEILLFGIKDALRKLTSIFAQDDDETAADSFVVMCGYGKELESAMEKIAANSYKLNRDVNNKLIVMSWVLRLYSDIKLRRIVAIKSLQKGQALTGSQLEKREMNNMIRELKKIDDDSLIEGAIGKAFSNFTRKNIRQYEDDYYDYNLRVKNVTHEDDALSIMHSINVRINIIEDYLESEDVSPSEVKRLSELIVKFRKLRDILANKNVYGSDYTRLYITYPDIVQDRR